MPKATECQGHVGPPWERQEGLCLHIHFAVMPGPFPSGPPPTPFLLPFGVPGVQLSLGIDVTLTLWARLFVWLDVTMWPWVLLTCGEAAPELSQTPRLSEPARRRLLPAHRLQEPRPLDEGKVPAAVGGAPQPGAGLGGSALCDLRGFPARIAPSKGTRTSATSIRRRGAREGALPLVRAHHGCAGAAKGALC